MRKLFFPLVVALVAVVNSFASDIWLTDYDAAVAKSKEAKQPILAVFSGSDWCPPCIRLEKTILSDKAFLNYAEKNVVAIFVDFPRSKEMSAEQKKKNEALSGKFGIEGFPTILLLDAEGKVLAKQVGAAWNSPQEFIQWLQTKSK